MITVGSAKGKRYGLFGLGGSGLATAHALARGGATLICQDDNPEQVAKARADGLATGDLRDTDFTALDGLVLAPGVPLTHPKPHWTAEKAGEAGIPVIGDIEIFARERRHVAPDCNFIAITGTNGKSTTTALIAHVLRSAGRDTQMGGNIGTAVLSLEAPAPNRHFVIECSSYQIDLAPSIDPSVGILLNLSPDHLDRHGTMENYASIKKRLVDASRIAIVGVDDPFSETIAEDIERDGRPLIRVSGSRKVASGIYLSGTKLIDTRDGHERDLYDLTGAPSLRGAHNAQNAAAAWAACEASGLSDREIIAGFESFPGLSHRMEQVGRLGRTLFINDSKGTNADAAGRALASFDRVYWIAGGLAKDGGIEPLRHLFPHVAKAYLIGEAAPAFAVTLGGDVAFEISGTLEQAIVAAMRDAADDPHHEPVVMLSPACASFDQFRNFEVRGNAFRDIVQALEGFEAFEEAI